MNISQLQHERIVVLGMGVNNQALAAYLIKNGCHLTLRDRSAETKEQFAKLYPDLPANLIDWQLQDDVLANLETFTIAIRTPVIPAQHPRFLALPGLTVTSQTKLFFEWSPAKIVGVTGTKGKGTTCTLIANILRAGNMPGNVYLAGNIGVDPFSFYEDLQAQDTVVLELSSFQLEDVTQSPHIAVVLRIGQDHLDRHQSVEEYRTAKLQLIANQTAADWAIVNEVNLPLPFSPIGQLLSYNLDQAIERDYKELVTVNVLDRTITIDTTKRQLLGRHNLENIIPAITVAGLCGISDQIIEQEVVAFPGLEHRLQFVVEASGARFYDDSIATTPEASMVGIEAFAGRRLHLIAGGNSKGGDYTAWVGLVAERCASISLLPGSLATEWQSKIATSIQEKGSTCRVQLVAGENPASTAIQLLKPHLQPGDVVLLAPGGTSFASYRSYKERGEAFVRAAKELAQNVA